MAKAIAPGISDETKDMIDNQVKKGQPRKFFLIYKGTSIHNLVVFKKGPFGPKIMQAKKDGFRGDVACGIVSGSGQNLLFQLPGNGNVAAAMKVESWEEEPPTQEAKLRAFLIDNGLHFKAKYSIITEESHVLDPEDDTVVEKGNDQAAETAVQEPGGVGEDSAAGASLKTACQQIKAAVYPTVKPALVLHPERKDDMIRLLGLASKYEQAGKFQDAIGSYKNLRSMIEQLTSGGNEHQSLYNGLREKVLEDLRRLQEVNAPVAEKVRQVIDSAAGHARKGEFNIAFTYLEKAAAAIAKTMGAARAEVTATNEQPDSRAQTAPTTTDATSWKKARQRWDEANTAVNAQIGALQAKLRQSSEPVLNQIAEFGMNGLTGDHKVKLMASLVELGEGEPAAMSKAGRTALAIIVAFRMYLETDERVDVCDDNPFDVPVSIRATLGGALAEMQAAIEGALTVQYAT